MYISIYLYIHIYVYIYVPETDLLALGGNRLVPGRELLGEARNLCVEARYLRAHLGIHLLLLLLQSLGFSFCGSSLTSLLTSDDSREAHRVLESDQY